MQFHGRFGLQAARVLVCLSLKSFEFLKFIIFLRVAAGRCRFLTFKSCLQFATVGLLLFFSKHCEH